MSKKSKRETIGRKQAKEIALVELIDVAGPDFVILNKDNSCAWETSSGPYEITFAFDKAKPIVPNADGSVTICDNRHVNWKNYITFGVDLITGEVQLIENHLINTRKPLNVTDDDRLFIETEIEDGEELLESGFIDNLEKELVWLLEEKGLDAADMNNDFGNEIEKIIIRVRKMNPCEKVSDRTCSTIDNHMKNYCPVYNKEIEPAFCHETILALIGGFQGSVFPELRFCGKDIKEAKTWCRLCPHHVEDE